MSERIGAVREYRPRFVLQRFSEIRFDCTPNYLIKGIIPAGGLTVIWGPPKCGKSFWTLDLSMHVALGWPYRGRRVSQGGVVYLCCEGERGFRARVEAYRSARLADGGDDEPPFYLIPSQINLAGDHKQLCRDILGQLGPAPRLAAIVIDTLNRSLVGSESADADMTAYVRAADALREAFRCAVVLIHHCGHDGARPRGHSSLTAAADAQIAVRKAMDGVITTEVEFMKDGPEGETTSSRLQVIELGPDTDGDAITSCVVEPADPALATPPRRKLSPRNEVALRALQEVTAEKGQPLPPAWQLPPQLISVPLDDWKAELFSRSVLDRETNHRQQWKRLKEDLLRARAISIRELFVWPL